MQAQELPVRGCTLLVRDIATTLEARQAHCTASQSITQAWRQIQVAQSGLPYSMEDLQTCHNWVLALAKHRIPQGHRHTLHQNVPEAVSRCTLHVPCRSHAHGNLA